MIGHDASSWRWCGDAKWFCLFESFDFTKWNPRFVRQACGLQELFGRLRRWQQNDDAVMSWCFNSLPWETASASSSWPNSCVFIIADVQNWYQANSRVSASCDATQSEIILVLMMRTACDESCCWIGQVMLHGCMTKEFQCIAQKLGIIGLRQETAGATLSVPWKLIMSLGLRVTANSQSASTSYRYDRESWRECTK